MTSRTSETVSAVSAVFHENTDYYQQFYEKYGPDLSGFPGIWQLCAEAGEVLDEVLCQHPDGSYDYIETVDMFVHYLQTDLEVPYTHEDLEEHAKNALEAFLLKEESHGS